MFILGIIWCVFGLIERRSFHWSLARATWAVISVWGFAQWMAGTTVYGYATLNVALRMAALGATAFIASETLANTRLRAVFLEAFVWFAAALTLVSLLAYFTSPGRVLWVFPSPYPDVWGPFLSRNDFAGFLGLALPVALWLALGENRAPPFLWIAALFLAAGIASASRAGAALLALEALVILAGAGRWRMLAKFAAAAILLVAVAGGGTLSKRLTEPDPLRYRREIASSTVRMIADRPWSGFGLGTFVDAYPAYATFDMGAVVDHAHDDWLEWASEGGVPFAAAWLLLALAAAFPAARSVWGVGIIAMFLHATVDYPFARFGLTAWTFVLLGALDSAK